MDIYIIGINHGFSCINLRLVPRKVFEHEPAGRVFKHLPRDPANVNARKNMVDRYICSNLRQYEQQEYLTRTNERAYFFVIAFRGCVTTIYSQPCPSAKHRQFKNFMRIISQITIASERKKNVKMMAKSVEILRKDNDCFKFERNLDFKVRWE